jgi:GH43 family beta-xylosidase
VSRRLAADLAATLLGLLLLFAIAPAEAAGSSFRNPVVPQTASGDDSPDPWIFRSGGRDWLTYTTQGRIIVRRARTLAGLASAHPKQLWPRPGSAEPDERCCEVWAPEIHRMRGPEGHRWYVYFSAKGSTDGDVHRMYVLESAADDPAGPYHYKAQLASPQPFSIDATVATIGGNQFLIYSGGSTFSPTSLYLAALANPWTIAAPPIEISSPTLAWETIPFGINEGPEVLPHGDELNVIYSASWCGTGAYALGRLTVPRSAELTDPATWTDAKSPSPVFSKAIGRGVYGPGHGSFFTSPDGRESWMVYHATDEDRGCFTGGLRTTRAQRFRWDGDIPRFGRPVGLGTDIAAPGGDGTIAVQAEDANPRTRVPRDDLVADHRLVGYEGLRVEPRHGRLPALRLHVPRTGRYELHLRLLGGPDAGPISLVRPVNRARTRSAERANERPIELDYGKVRLRRGFRVLRQRSPDALTLDQVRLERRRR